MRVAVYTALYGSHDLLVDPVTQDLEVDWVCFTDDPSLESKGWSVRHDPARFDDPRLAAKWHKALPTEVLPDHDATIWVDASLRIDSPAFVREVLSTASGPITAFAHPQRDCIYDEAMASARLPKYDPTGLTTQVAAYSEAGHPRHWGLWACGVLARDSRDPSVAELGRRWLSECQRWTLQDQLSFAFVCRQIGVRPGTFPHHLHRHGFVDDLVCRLHRHPWFSRIAARRAPASNRDADSPPTEPTGPLRAVTRTNPWFWIAGHRTDR